MSRQLNLCAGAPGYGKSTFIANIVKASPDPNALIYIEEVDIESDAWADFPLVDFYKYKGGKCKVSAETIKYDEFLKQCAKHFRNGIVVIDEGGLYERGKLSLEMIRLMATRRKIFVNIFIIYHGVSAMPINQFMYVNNIILFHTADSFAHKKQWVPRMDELLRAKEEITRDVMNGKKYSNRFINLS